MRDAAINIGHLGLASRANLGISVDAAGNRKLTIESRGCYIAWDRKCIYHINRIYEMGWGEMGIR